MFSNSGNSDDVPANKAECFVIMTQDILCRKDLSILAKLVYARISGFKEFWESAEETGKFFNKSADSIRRAKQDLEKLGLIKCIKNTGRGKCYIAELRLVKNDESDYANDNRLCKNAQSDYAKMTNQTMQKCLPYNKEDNKEDNIDNNKLLSIVETTKTEYGNSEINEMFLEWERMFGFKQKNCASNRNACYNMLRSKDKGKEWLLNTMRIVLESTKDRYAGKSVNGNSNFTDIQRNYESIWLWGRKKWESDQENTMLDLNNI